MPYEKKYNLKKFFIGTIGLILILVFGCTIPSMGLDVVARDNEPDLTVEGGSNFPLTIALMNPESDINGNYIIISDKDLKASVETALTGSGFNINWDDKQTSYTIRSENMLRKSWDEQVGWFFDAIDIVENLLLGGPDPVGIITSYTGDPVDWTLDFGDKYRDSDLQKNTNAFETCMKSGAQFPISGTLNKRSLTDGILIPPTTNIIIQVPLDAPNYKTDYTVNLNIPCFCAIPMTRAPVPCGFRIALNQATWEKTIVVEVEEENGATSIREKAPGIYYSGVATRSRDRQAWPFKLTLIGPDIDGSINGQIEWTNLNSISKIEGSKTTTGVTFTEVNYIKKGNAILDCRYDLTPNGNSFTGTWSCLDGQQGDITVNPSSISTEYYSGVATRSRDRQAWPFKLTLIGPDTDGSINGQIEWTTLNAIHLIEGSQTASGITFRETAYIKRGNAVLNCRYYLKPDGSSFKGTWDSCSEGAYGDVAMNPL